VAKGKEVAVSKGLKSLFLIHGIFALFFGFLFCFAPLRYVELFKYFGPVNLFPLRLLGAFILVLGFKDWFCFTSSRWDEVRIVVIMEIALTILATIACLSVLYFTWAPSDVWICYVIFPVFAVAWIYFYIEYR
jgi:hypothetical protein